jgi:hypothetical protein
MIVVLGAAGAAMTPAGVGVVASPSSPKPTTLALGTDVRSRADDTVTVIGPVPFSDRRFFTRLATLLACSNDWFAALGGFLGNGDAFSRVVTVANTCQPVTGLYQLGKWIAGNEP